MKKTKMEKGITLVALIITIVVLLILAVVAITAIQNDGILSHAGNAANGYTSNQLLENGLLNDYESLLNQYNGGNGLTEEELAELDLVERYFLGAEKTGRSSLEIANIDMSTLTITSFKDDPDSIIDASTSMELLSLIADNDALKGYVYAKYNNRIYFITTDGQTLTTESVERIVNEEEIEGVPFGREGQSVWYNSDEDSTLEEWVVLTDRNGVLEIVSADVMYDSNTLNLVYLDEYVTVTEDLDGDGTIGNNVDKAIASYNNAITTINNYCKGIVTATDNEGVRSIGANTDTAQTYSSTNFNSWFKGTTTVKTGDMSYKKDLDKMVSLGIASATRPYWIASRYVTENSSKIVFSIRVVRFYWDSDLRQL